MIVHISIKIIPFPHKKVNLFLKKI